MKKVFSKLVDHRKLVLVVYLILLIISVFCSMKVKVNGNLADYLPADSRSTISLDIMGEEFENDIPNASLMVPGLTIPEAGLLKEELLEVSGVINVTGVTDAVEITQPVETMDQKTLTSWYQDGYALFSITIDADYQKEALHQIRELAGEGAVMSGSAVESASVTLAELFVTIAIAIFVALVILMLATTSWLEPFLLLLALSVAIVINAGTNLLLGEISVVTNTAASILQLGVSVDYSIFLLHRFEEYRKEGLAPREAMIEALTHSLTSIVSSGVTTVIGFAALILMQYRIGADMGVVMSKGILISMIAVFTLLPALTLGCYKLLDKTHHRSLLPKADGLAKLIYRLRVPVLILFVLVTIPSFLASSRNDFYYGASHMYSEDSEVVREKEQIEEVFGKSNIIVLMVPKGNFPEEIALSEDLHNIPEVLSVTSYVDTVGAEIPEEYLTADQRSQLISDRFSRMIVKISCNAESEGTFQVIDELKAVTASHYGDTYYLAGDSISTEDLKTVITEDKRLVEMIAIAAIFLVLMISFRSLSIPVILVASIESAIWINLAVPYFQGQYLFFIGYLIISSVQLGATVDYAILIASRYLEVRKTTTKMNAFKQCVRLSVYSVLTSALIMSEAGALLGMLCSNQLIAQLGFLLARGTLFSAFIVLFVLPILLYLFDGVNRVLTLYPDFHKEDQSCIEQCEK